MISRHRGQSDRAGRFAHTRSHFDSLEARQLLSQTAVTGLVTNPTLVQLVDVSAKNRVLTSAGAKLFRATQSLTAANRATQFVNADEFTPFTVQLDALKSLLQTAPMEFTAAAKKPLVLALPNPDGGFSRFNIVEAPIMEQGLADKYPTMKTYRGIGIDNSAASVRLDYTPLGFHAQVLAGDSSFYIDPYHLNDVNGTYLSYYKQDLVRSSADTFECDTDSLAQELGIAQNEGEAAPQLGLITYGGTLKTYRAAVGCSYQYCQAVGGNTVAGGQAAIVTAMNRVTGVYETELSIRLTLVANNDQLVYTSATSASSFANTSSVINTSTSKISGIIGVANYDIGHVFTTGSGGVAFLGVVGSASNKGGGTTGSPSPTGDAFYIDYVAHEMGHQFGGNHTFNTANDTGNRSANHAYEPGSGLSIMAYAGIEGADDLAGHSIPYFHSESIDEIRTFIGTIPSVGTSSSTGDLAPSVNAGPDYVIPTGTNFALTATGSDPDGDTLTYDWQQRDRGAATLLSTADNGASPLFTEVPPSTNPTRLLPRLQSILGGFLNTVAGGTAAAAVNVLGAGSNTLTARLAERMYAVARTSNWRVTARDNRGGLSTDDMVLTVVNTGAPFAITNFGSFVSMPGGSNQTITWNVAGTTAAPINVANVKISLSLDSGQTYPYVLAASTANDGSETVQIPYSIASSTARFKVEAIGSIFFDINNTGLTITNVSPVSQQPGLPVLTTDTGTSATDGLTNRNNSSPASVLGFQVPNTVSGALVELLVDGNVIGSATATGTTTVVTTNGISTLADGLHSFSARQTEPGKTVSPVSTLGSLTIDTAAPTLASAPVFNFETGHSLTYVFGEAGIGNFSASAITVSDGVNTIPATVSYDSGSLTTTITFGGLLNDGNYTSTLTGSAITDAAGNALVTGSPLSFFVLAGDANRDRVISFDDLLIITQSYNLLGQTFSQGNVNYDSNGDVDFNDLLLLAQTYGNSILAAGRPAAATPYASSKKRIAESIL